MGLAWMCLPFLGSCPSLLWMYHHTQDNTFPRGCYCLAPNAAPALVFFRGLTVASLSLASPPALLPLSPLPSSLLALVLVHFFHLSPAPPLPLTADEH